MKGFLKVVLARWLARTPLGLAALGIGWYLGRRRKRRREQEQETTEHRARSGAGHRRLS